MFFKQKNYLKNILNIYLFSMCSACKKHEIQDESRGAFRKQINTNTSV